MSSDAIVYVVDDDRLTRRSLELMLSSRDLRVSGMASATDFLSAYDDDGRAPRCLVLDVSMPEMSGIELLTHLSDTSAIIPVILVTGHAEVPLAVQAMRKGAFDFLEKPISRDLLLQRVDAALACDARRRADRGRNAEFRSNLQSLSRRQREVFELLVSAKNIKQIAAELNIGVQTAAKHRAAVLKKLDVKNEVELVQLNSAANQQPASSVSRTFAARS